MKSIVATVFFWLAVTGAEAQRVDSFHLSGVTVIMDNRLNELSRRELAFNDAFSMAPKIGRGYRLIVLTTSDRNLSQRVRAQLLQRYPDHKAYTVFQSPNIKLKFGNFVERADAEAMRKDIIRNAIVSGNIYIVPEDIEIRPEKKVKEED